MIRFSFIVFFLFLLVSCKKDLNDEGRLDTVGVLLSAVDTSSGEAALLNLKKALDYNGNVKHDSLRIDRYFKIAAKFYELDEAQYFREASLKAYMEAQDIKDTVAIVRASIYLGKYYANKGVNDSAFYYYSKSEKVGLTINDSTTLASIYINKAFVQLKQNDFFGCELSASKVLNYLIYKPDRRKEYDAFNLIGICASEMKNHSRAIDYYNRALKVSQSPELDSHLHLGANTMNNLGVVYQDINDHARAIQYFSQALQEKNLLEESPALYAILLDNFAYSKFKIGDTKGILDIFLRALKIRTDLNLYSGIVINKIHLSEYYQRIGDSILALRYAKEALSVAKQTSISGDLLGSLKHIATIDSQNEAKYSKMYIRINDSLQQEERKMQDKFARIQFETNELSQEKEKLAEQNRTLLYFFVGAFLIGLLLFVIRAQRAKNRELLLIQAQQKANEEIYNLMIAQQSVIEESRAREKKRIAKELHDGVLGRLFGTRLNLDSLNKQCDETAVLKRTEYLNELKNIEQDIREISHDLNREKYIIINNFVAILHNLVEDQESNFGSKIKLEIDDNIRWDTVSNTKKINIYRIIQECFQNINKYAKATEIRVNIKLKDGIVIVSIADNGIGFKLTQRKKGIGLQNMLSRANEMGGTLDVRSKVGKGTTISVSFPM